MFSYTLIPRSALMIRYIVLVVLPLASFAQNEEEEYVKTRPKPTRGFEFSIQITSGIGYRHLPKPESTYTAMYYHEPRTRSESPHGAVSAGLLAGYRVHTNVAVEVGTFYSYTSYCRNRLEHSGYNPAPIIYLRTIYRYESLDIPVRLRLNVGTGKFRFTGSIGATTNVYLRAVESYQGRWHENEETRFIENTTVDVPKRVNLSPNISAGFEADITNSLGFRVEPSFSINALPTNINEYGLQEHLWTAGIGIILFFKTY